MFQATETTIAQGINCKDQNLFDQYICLLTESCEQLMPHKVFLIQLKIIWKCKPVNLQYASHHRSHHHVRH